MRTLFKAPLPRPHREHATGKRRHGWAPLVFSLPSINTKRGIATHELWSTLFLLLSAEKCIDWVEEKGKLTQMCLLPKTSWKARKALERHGKIHYLVLYFPPVRRCEHTRSFNLALFRKHLTCGKPHYAPHRASIIFMLFCFLTSSASLMTPSLISFWRYVSKSKGSFFAFCRFTYMYLCDKQQ